MTGLLYFLIAIGATTVGALTGMGGGVIIKPVMDVIGAYDAATIGVLSSITVFSMSVVSIGKQMLARTRIPFAAAIPLAIGSVAGGQLGQMMLTALTAGLPNTQVTAVQNVGQPGSGPYGGGVFGDLFLLFGDWGRSYQCGPHYLSV